MSRSHYKHGDYNCIDDYTGFKEKRSECKYTWDGYLVHRRHWESRHPQETIRGVPDHQAVPDPRPDSDPEFVTVNQVKPEDL